MYTIVYFSVYLASHASQIRHIILHLCYGPSLPKCPVSLIDPSIFITGAGSLCVYIYIMDKDNRVKVGGCASAEQREGVNGEKHGKSVILSTVKSIYFIAHLVKSRNKKMQYAHAHISVIFS